MPNLITERVLDVYHWNSSLFTFKTTRNRTFRFQSGEFVMLGMEFDGKPIMRAYSFASGTWEDHLEFLSIKIPDGALTSRLQDIEPGDDVLLSTKPTGSLLIHDLWPGRRLFLFATGTGIAPFISIIKDPETYERFGQVILCHSVRHKEDLAYYRYLTRELPDHELLGEIVKSQFRYFPTVTRERFMNQGRLTDLVRSDKLTELLDQAALHPNGDRAMLCGNEHMLSEFREILDARGFRPAKRIGDVGDYVFERAYVEKD